MHQMQCGSTQPQYTSMQVSVHHAEYTIVALLLIGFHDGLQDARLHHTQ